MTQRFISGRINSLLSALLSLKDQTILSKDIDDIYRPLRCWRIVFRADLLILGDWNDYNAATCFHSCLLALQAALHVVWRPGGMIFVRAFQLLINVLEMCLLSMEIRRTDWLRGEKMYQLFILNP